MNEMALWTVGAIGSGLIGVVLAVMFDSPIRGLLRIATGRRARPYPLDGDWRAVFSMPDGTSYVEMIRIRKRFGKAEGRIIPHHENYLALRSVEYKRPIRIEGDLSTSDIFSGTWLHPIETSRYHGTFQLLLHPNGETLTGQWLGYSESRQEIVSGLWNMRRC